MPRKPKPWKSPPKPAPKKRGRKPILNVVNVTIAVVETRGNITRIAERFNVARASVQEFIGKHPELVTALASEREKRVDVAEEALDDFLKVRDREGLTAVIFTLKTQGKRRGWIEANRIEMANADGEPFKTDNVTTVMTAAQKIAKLEELFRNGDASTPREPAEPTGSTPQGDPAGDGPG